MRAVTNVHRGDGYGVVTFEHTFKWLLKRMMELVEAEAIIIFFVG